MNYLSLTQGNSDFEDFDDEIVAIDSRSGTFYSMKGRAKLVWRALADGLRLEEFRERLTNLNERESILLNEMIRDLRESGIAGDAPNGSGAIDPTAWTAEAPAQFEKNADFDDLIRLDPIHDISEDGWLGSRAS
jgi:hypothetical protein